MVQPGTHQQIDPTKPETDGSEVKLVDWSMKGDKEKKKVKSKRICTVNSAISHFAFRISTKFMMLKGNKEIEIADISYIGK